MKKAIKGLIVASAVAAVVGVGAVSFAAWSGSTDTTKEVTGATGEIKTVGAITVTPTAASGTLESMKALVPYNQTGTFEGVKYWEFDLSCDVTGGQQVTYTVEGALGEDGDDIGSAELRWAEAAPTADTDGAELSATTPADITGTKVFIFLVATGTDAMNTNITVTFGVKEAA